ncbi:MAG: biopolymer transporter ExbD [Phaeovulum sp.]|uniref:ExbD/TolR family protein n=1 Tax=Phaeovulum sp. TaxID=2934796 RepID=UPI0027314B7D|nr:biopolymer transporter ExbD [Phaeovulum sp.]MDP2062520.1 biopolymer transporter ExbD [Phaeovulum sp.]
MNFSTPLRRRPAENLLPMINVVFLLLIFFLIAAKLAPPEPFAVALPEALAEGTAEADFTLHLATDGRLGFAGAEGAAALQALAAARAAYCAGADCTDAPPRLALRADAGAPAAALAALLPALAGAGFGKVTLVTAGR